MSSPSSSVLQKAYRNAVIQLWYAFLLAQIVSTAHVRQVCERRDAFFDTFYSVCLPTDAGAPVTYLLYDVNPGEGFNLRRDVYIRLAVFLKHLKTQPGYQHSKLVLAPWSYLVHWRSRHIDQGRLLWNNFFDVPSLQRYTDVIDMDEFFADYARTHGTRAAQQVTVDEVYQLRHYDHMLENGAFVDKFEEHACPQGNRGTAVEHLFGYTNFSGSSFRCLFFQGSAMLLQRVLDKYGRQPGTNRVAPSPRYVVVLNAEIVLHDYWGNVDYWEARRSMRFAKPLVAVANQFRLAYLNSSDEHDRTVRPARWTDERAHRSAQGGSYLCAHLRRVDFLDGREKTTPTIQSAALQIRAKLLELGLRTVFVASDCSRTEFHNLKNYLKRFRVVRYEPESYEQRATLKDGGVAIVDQLVCSYARYFIGTYESTFTYRIYEEREILGFAQDLTFNTFCKHENDDVACEKNTVWPIVYD
ncbi:GDP-fucose protein O-fucosyltransferase 2 [Anopheles cruzii]|uniref:GDP-fucose protein O-fucosyltransferase 2 n=1 Tax=Anopheles cruzii TaxID=68878 RepID=UPI0022EC5FE8|nr:GDP-fucose protein O-fucosyltransferase 2 [Anopheles cruzii]